MRGLPQAKAHPVLTGGLKESKGRQRMRTLVLLSCCAGQELADEEDQAIRVKVIGAVKCIAP